MTAKVGLAVGTRGELGTAKGGPPRSVRARLASNVLLRQNALLFAANMATSLFSYLFHPVVGHLLGATGYGTIVSLSSFAVVLTIPTQIVANIANKFTADLTAQGQMEQVNRLIRVSTRYALIMGVVAAGLFVGLSPALAGFLKSAPQLLIILSLGYVFSFAHPLNTGVVQGRQQFGWFASLNFLVAFSRVALTGVILLLGYGVQGVLWGNLAATVVLYALSFLPLRDVLRLASRPLPPVRPMVVYSLGATLVVSGSLLLTNTDIILAKHFLSGADAGYYAALATMGRVVLFVGGSFVWVMFPKVAALSAQGKPHHAVLGWTLAGVFALSAAVVVLFGLFPDKVITFIFHAPLVVSGQLVWYSLAMLLLALSNVFISYYLSLGRMAFVPFLLCCCVLQIGLIGVWHGSIGQIVVDIEVSMAVLLAGLTVLYVVQFGRPGARRAGTAVEAA